MALQCARTVYLFFLVILLAEAKISRKGTIKYRDHSGQLDIAGKCSSLVLNTQKIQQNAPTIPKPIWIQTPSIVKVGNNYHALGRVIHLKYLRERLLNQKDFNEFAATREKMDVVPRLEILADTVYIEDTVDLKGIEHVQIYTREIVGATGSKLIVSAPNWIQKFSAPQTGKNGTDGNHGLQGPHVDILCDIVRGVIDVTSNAGDGHKGQAGGRGERASSSGHTQPDKGPGECTGQTDYCTCDDVKGEKGIKGKTGGKGGNAGKPGNGGNAGNVNIRYRKLNGQVKLKSCKGQGGPYAANGIGGLGGAGGTGGRGRECIPRYTIIAVVTYTDETKRGRHNKDNSSEEHERGKEMNREKRKEKLRNRLGECPGRKDEIFRCNYGNASERLRGDQGDDGDTGPSGTTPNVAGDDGSVTGFAVQSGTLDKASKQKFPVAVLSLIRRQAEDFLLSNSDDQKGREALQFVLSIAEEISGDVKVERIKKYIKRKLAFLGKPGYDIFGNNKQFAPRIKWEALEGTVEDIKDAAEKYENAFNEIISEQVDAENFQEIGSKISEVSSRQVKSEKERLKQAKYIAETEKRLYVKGIKFEEEKMTFILENIVDTFGTTYKEGKFNVADFIAVLEGLVGFGKAIKGGNPGDFIETALGLVDKLRGKDCIKTLPEYTSSIQKWLTFGEVYEPREDSSELDFDQLDVTSIPEIMMTNLEMNKEQLTKDFVCLLEETLPQDKAEFIAEVESFFIAAANRIDLIAKVLDLDNDIGGYQFDIPLLEETENAIADVGKGIETPLSTSLQQNFLDYLLSTYRTLERSFMRSLYELYKAFVFRTLWEGNNPLSSFQRVSSESARGTARLNGAVELTSVLQKMKRDQDKAVNCFTNIIYATGIKKWSFDSTKNKKMFEQLVQGYTRFSLKVDQSCDTCYNLRLLQIYIELYGTGNQPSNVPATVLLQVRHLSVSYFRAGDKSIKQYRQPVGSYRNIKFDRFTITNERKCQRRKKKGKCSLFSWACLTEGDTRWQPVCNNQLNRGACTNQDRLMGMEECKSPFGIYELKIPVDKTLECNDDRITNTNCKDLDLTKFTNMNVWTHFYYWSDHYPSGPDDPICKVPLDRRSKTPVRTPTSHNTEGCNSTSHIVKNEN